MKEKIDYGCTYGFKNFVDEDTQRFFLSWIDENKPRLKNNGTNMIVGNLDKIETAPNELIESIRSKIVEFDEIQNYKTPNKSVNFISVYGKGSECGIHSDPIPDEDYVHVRYNLLLSRADLGGNTIYDKNFLDIEERVLWKCVAQYSKHGCDVVMSNKPRTLISMGFFVKKDDISLQKSP